MYLQQVYRLGRTPAPKAGGRKEDSLCGCPELLRQHTGQGRLSFDGTELGWPELARGPLLRSCPRMGPSPNRDAANWKQMVPGRLGLQDEAGWWAHIHTHSHLHTHTLSLTDFNTHIQTLTNTNTHLPTRHFIHIHSLASITHKPAITLSHIYSQINTFTHVPLSLDLTDRHLLFSSDPLNPPPHPIPRQGDHSRACSDPIQFSVLWLVSLKAY